MTIIHQWESIDSSMNELTKRPDKPAVSQNLYGINNLFIHHIFVANFLVKAWFTFDEMCACIFLL